MSTTVLIATPLDEALVARIERETSGFEILFDPTLLPSARYPSDHVGDPSFRRDDHAQERFEEWMSRAEVSLGIPGERPEGLVELVGHGKVLRWVQGTAAGTGQQVRAAGLTSEVLDRVTITSSVGVHASQLAEWAMLGLLWCAKDVPRLVQDREAHHWDHYPVRELRGQRLLVVGLGHIGREVARMARALGMRVTGVRRSTRPEDPTLVDSVCSIGDLLAVVPTMDAVVLALPATEETEGLFSRELVDAMPGHAALVNVGRGTTLDQDALVEALREGRLAGAALDVFAEEPLPADSPLWQLGSVLISPHTAALSARENELIVDLFIDNLTRYRRGEQLRNVVDPHRFY